MQPRVVSMVKTISLLLLDDHGLFREGLGRLLQDQSDMEVLGDYSSVELALEALSKQPDLVLLDFDLGETDGLAFLRQCNEKGFQGKVLVVTAGMSRADTLSMLQAGAAGVFLKHNSPPDLIRAIRSISAGQAWIDAETLAALTSGAVPREPAANPAQFSVREKAVLQGILQGQSNKEIAASLSISEGYVKAVLQQLFLKAGVRTRSQLVRIILESPAKYDYGA